MSQSHATTSTTESRSSPFLDRLPRELRDQIYRFILLQPRGTVFKPNKYAHGSLCQFNEKGEKIFLLSKPWALLLVCKQVYVEAGQVFFGGNSFKLSAEETVNLGGKEGIVIEGKGEEVVVRPLGWMKRVFIV